MNTTERKIQELKQIGFKRKQQCYEGHFPISHTEFHNGVYESDFVSPYSKSACNVDSKIMILLQDWVSYDKLKKPYNKELAELGHDKSLPTNKNLKVLLTETFGLQLQDVFATNVFPYIKPKGMSSAISKADIIKAYKEFCYPQIEVVKPNLVICCGKPAYEAALNYFNMPTNNLELVCNQFQRNGTLFYHQFHTGGMGVVVARGFDNVKKNWMRMKKDYEQFLKDQ